MGIFKESIDRLLGVFAGAVTTTDILDMVRRDRFSEFLPYRIYDPENDNMFSNSDKTIGFIWECAPLYFASDAIADNLAGLFNIGFPEGTVMQFILHADPHIEPIVEKFKAQNTIKDNPVINSATEEFAEFLLSGKKGLDKVSGIPVRNFRLFITIKYPDPKGTGLTEIIKQQIKAAENVLRGAYLHPQRMDADWLVDWLFRLFNDEVNSDRIEYDDTRYLNEQIIKSETVIHNHKEHLQIGKKIFKCLSIKTAPKKVTTLQTRQLIGGIWGVSSDGAQINSPFIYSVNIIFQDLKKEITGKAMLTLRQIKGQKETSTRTLALGRRQEEFQIATDQLEQGVPFVKIIPLLWIYDDDENKVESAVTNAAKVVWGQQGYEMQRDWGILTPLFISSLPFGLYNVENNVQMINRHFIAPPDTCVRVLPYQGGYSGSSARPMEVFIDRNGQLCSLDRWDRTASNQNGLICASTGKGKSVKLNYQIWRYLANGTQVFVVDIGRSYEKSAKINKGKYLRFSKDSKVCINPFSNLDTETEEDLKHEIAATASNLMNMVYSSTSPELDETEITTMKNAATWAYQQEGDKTRIDTVCEYLWKFPFYAKELKEFESRRSIENITEQAHRMAYNLSSFCTDGIYGRWFNGPTTFDISQDQYAVLELEELQAVPELFKVVTRQVLDYVTKAIYLGPRDKRKLIEFDEAHLFLKNNPFLNALIEQIYRRVRKYNGGIDIITQSVLDLNDFPGGVGRVIWNCSDFKFLLESTDYVRAKNEKVIVYDDFVMKLLTGVRIDQGRYSEMFVDTPGGVGVVRLVLPDYLYYMFTTKGDEVAEIDRLVAQFKSSNPGVSEHDLYDLAIKEMIRRYRR